MNFISLVQDFNKKQFFYDKNLLYSIFSLKLKPILSLISPFYLLNYNGSLSLHNQTLLHELIK